MADALPIQLYVGDDWTILVPITDSSGNALDLTGYTVVATFYNNGISSSLTVGNGGVTITSVPNGQVTLFVGKATTAAVPSQSPTANTFPTRFAVILTNGAGFQSTVGIIPIIPLNPATA